MTIDLATQSELNDALNALDKLSTDINGSFLPAKKFDVDTECTVYKVINPDANYLFGVEDSYYDISGKYLNNAFTFGSNNIIHTTGEFGGGSDLFLFGNDNLISVNKDSSSSRFYPYNVFLAGEFNKADQINTTHAANILANAFGLGIRTDVRDRFSFTWNGDDYLNKYYTSKGDGSFAINPKNGTNGFFIGDKSLSAILSDFVLSSSVMDQLSGLDTLSSYAKKIELKETIKSNLDQFQGYSDNPRTVATIAALTNWTKAIHDTLMDIANLTEESPAIETEQFVLDPGKTYLITNKDVAAINIYAEKDDLADKMTITAYDIAD